MRASVPNPVPTPVSRVPQQPVGYSRYDQERFKGKEGMLIVTDLLVLYIFILIISTEGEQLIALFTVIFKLC